MIQKHSSDAKIQEYVFNPTHCDSGTILHINTCEVCRQAAQQYQLLFTEVENLPTLTFDFNVSDLVLPQLKPKPKIVFDFMPVVISGALVLVGLGFVAYSQGFNFWAYFQDLKLPEWISEISNSTLLLITMVISVLFFVILDIRKNFQKKLQALSIF